jgi:transcriptional regulator with XRE-family HTH domain
MSDIAEQLRSLRKASGKTLAAVAAEAGLSSAYLSDIERGRRATLDTAVTTLNKILACYGMELHIEIRPKQEDSHV